MEYYDQMPPSRPHPDGGYIYNPNRGFIPTDPRWIEGKSVEDASKRLGNSLVGYYLFSFALAYASKMILNLFSLLRVELFSGGGMPLDLVSDMTRIIATIVGLLLPFVLFMEEKGARKGNFIPLKPPRASAVATAVFITLSVAVIGAGAATDVSDLFEAVHINFVFPSYTFGTTPSTMAVSAIQIIIVPAIVEEIVFRGIVLQSLRRLGDGFALVLSSFAFALLHGNPVQMPYAFLLGMVIGYFVLATGSVTTGIIAHFANNLITVVISLLTVFTTEYAVPMKLAAFAVLLLLGAVCFSIYVRKDKGAFKFAPVNTYFTFAQKLRIFFSQWQVILAMAVTLFLSLQYVKVG